MESFPDAAVIFDSRTGFSDTKCNPYLKRLLVEVPKYQKAVCRGRNPCRGSSDENNVSPITKCVGGEKMEITT